MKCIFKITVAALLCLTAPTMSLAQTPTSNTSKNAISQRHAAAIKDILVSLHVPDVFFSSLRQIKGTPNQDEFMRSLIAHTSSDDLLEMTTPAYAKFISEEDALEMAQNLKLSGLKKTFDHLMLDLISGVKSPQPILTPAEQMQLVHANSLTSFKKFVAQQTKISSESLNLGVELGRRYQVTLLNRVFAAVRLGTQKIEVSDNLNDPNLMVFDTVNISYLDNLIAISLDTNLKNTRAARELNADLSAYGAGKTLVPEHLVSKEGIAEGKALLDKCEARVESYLATIDALITEHRVNMEKVDFPAKADFMRSLQKGMESAYVFNLDFGENQRKLFGIYHKFFEFAEAREGEVAVDQGKLVFKTDEDVKIYSALIAEMNAAIAEVRALVNKRINDEEKMIAPLRADGTRSSL